MIRHYRNNHDLDVMNQESWIDFSYRDKFPGFLYTLEMDKPLWLQGYPWEEGL